VIFSVGDIIIISKTTTLSNGIKWKNEANRPRGNPPGSLFGGAKKIKCLEGLPQMGREHPTKQKVPCMKFY